MSTRAAFPPSLLTLAAVAFLLLPSALPARAADAPRPASAPAPSFEKLQGRWLRDTGGYVIEVRSVGKGGKVDAAYFNPASIHVGKAEARMQGSQVSLVVVLQDVNYPGSTYTLAYDTKGDRLVGRYYQAATGQTFDVYFVRLRS
jgi:uncharacterized protein (DUF2147 family)